MGGYLSEAGNPIVLITRPAHAAAIRERGLIVRTAKGTLQPSLTALTSVKDVHWQPDDVIFITCKSQNTRELLEELATAPKETPVFCFQNGVRNEEWAAETFSNVYAGLVQISANFVEPGVVEHTRNDVLAIGKYPSGLDSITTNVGQRLESAGFKLTYYDRAMPRKWGKLLVNLNNAIHALIDTWLQRSYTEFETRTFMADTMREGLRVINAAGIDIEMGPGDPTAAEFVDRMAVGAFAYANPMDLPPDRRTYPSTWQDVRLHRETTEVEHFNGEIVRLGLKLGIPTPFNTALQEMMRELLRSKAMPGFFTLEQVKTRVAEISSK